MTTIVTRQGKGSPLSTVEMDNNLTNLNNNKVETVNPTTSGTLIHTGDVSVSGKSVSNTLYANAYQSSVSNSGTELTILPNGTGNYTALSLFASATGNTPITQVVQTSTAMWISADKTGTGSYTPIAIYTSGIERFRISTSGALGLSGTNYGSSGQFLMSNGSSNPPTWNTVDLSTKVNKSGDTMTGNLTATGFTVSRTAPTVTLIDTEYGTRHLHHQNGNMGFLDTSGYWAFYENGVGQVWTKAYGWLHDYFSATGHTHNYAGVNSNFDWELVRNATIAANATLNVLSNYGYGIYYYTTSGSTGMLITCGNGTTFNMGTSGTLTTVTASDILTNSGSGGRTLYLYKLRKTA